MNVKPILRFLFVPQTDSPTIAYYAGLFSGVVLTLQVKTILDQRRERLMWAEKTLTDEVVQMQSEYLKLFPID